MEITGKSEMASVDRTYAERLVPLDTKSIPGIGVINRAATIIAATIGLTAVCGVISLVMVTSAVSVEAEGVVQPQELSSVRALESGRIASIYVSAGDSVREGDTILSLDPFELSYAVREADLNAKDLRVAHLLLESAQPLAVKSSLQAKLVAESMLERSRAEFARVLFEHARSTNVDSALQTAKHSANVATRIAAAEVRAAERRVESTVVDLERARADSLTRQRAQFDYLRAISRRSALGEQLRRLTLYAPTEGVVLTDNLEAKIGTQVQRGDALVEIGDLHSWRAELRINEADVQRIRSGQSVELELFANDRFRSIRLLGTVEKLSVEPQAVAVPVIGRVQTATYRLTVRILPSADEETQAMLRRGMAVRARVHIGRAALWRVLLEETRGS